jgi:hypothetical protein
MLASRVNRLLPSFDGMARVVVFYVESVPPSSVLVPNEDSKDKEIASDMKVDNGDSKNYLFVDSWMLDGVLDDMDEYEVVFEEEDITMASGFLSYALNADCSDVNKEALDFETEMGDIS